MNRFAAGRVTFGRPASDAPSPLTGKAAVRRTAMLAEAAEVLRHIPGPGESLHAVMTGRYDLMHVVSALIGRLGNTEAVRIATLCFNARNLAEMLSLLDSGKVGTLSLLCSVFFRDQNKDLWQETLSGFRQRGQKVAAARSHAKVVTLAFSDGRRFTLEGSANLRTNANREQFALFNDPALYEFHDTWIGEMVRRHEADATDDPAKG